MVYVALTRAVGAWGIRRLAGNIQHLFKLKRDKHMVVFFNSLIALSLDEAEKRIRQRIFGLKRFDVSIARSLLAAAAPAAVAK